MIRLGKRMFQNAKVFTSDDQKPFAECFLVEDGFITWIGTEAEMPKTDCEVVDLQGKRVIPGFIDAHMHPIILADNMQKLSCLPPDICSIEALKAAISQEAKQKAPDQWIQGWGYDEEKFSEHRAPNRWDLDQGTEGRPVELLRSCSHVRAVNSKALELAGITRDTPDPPGGEIDRDEQGEPTGILRENARHLIGEILPEKSRAQVVDSIVELGRLLLSQGIVAVTDMGNLDTVDYYDYYLEAAKQGFKQDVGMYYIWDLIRKNESFQWDGERADRSRQIHMSGIKLISDGSIGGRTAWMNQPYRGTENEYGISVCSDEEIESAAEFCKQHHCQLSCHAMGMRAIDRIMEKLGDEAPWTEQVPHLRLEHVTDPSKAAVRKAAEQGIMFATQAIFLYSEIESYRSNLGMEWIRRIYPIRQLLDAGVKTALSTDAPATSWATPSDPFPNIKCAVTRRAYDGTDCGRENCISVQEALKMYTVRGAEIAGFPHLGQLKEGYRASFAVLSDDILKIPEERIDTVCVEQTYMDGICVFER